MKKTKAKTQLTLTLLFLLLALSINSFHLSAIASPVLLKARINNLVSKGINLKMVPDSMLDTQLLLPGDFFSAKLTQPTAKLLNVPYGSRLLGNITDIKQARSYNRSAKLKAHLKTMLLPDGRQIKIDAQISSKASLQQSEDPSKLKNLGHNIKKKSSELAASSLVGAVDSVQYGGLGTAIMTSGISVGVGAGIGLGVGLVGALKDRGGKLASSGFEALNFKLDSEFVVLEEIPAGYHYVDIIDFATIGIDIKVNKVQKLYSRNYGEFILLDLEVANNSLNKIHLSDFALSSNKHTQAILNNPLLSSGMFTSLKTKEKCKCRIAFSLVKIHKEHHYKLTLIDAIQQNIIADANINLSEYL